MNKLPNELKIKIMSYLTGKHKRVFRNKYKLPKSPQKPQTKMYRRVRKTGVNRYYRFNKTPVVYRNPNWRYYLMATSPNGTTEYPIFFRSKNNVEPFIIHPRTGRIKNVNLYNHINANENYTNNMNKRNRTRNTWNSYLRRI